MDFETSIPGDYLLHLYPLRATLPPRDATEGGHVQVQAQARPRDRFLRPPGAGGPRVLRRGGRFPRDIRPRPPRRPCLRRQRSRRT